MNTFIMQYTFKQTLLSKATYSAFRLYIFFQYVRSLGIEPTTFCTANTMLYHWATGTHKVFKGYWYYSCLGHKFSPNLYNVKTSVRVITLSAQALN